LVLGSDPSSSKSSTFFAVSKDSNASAAHAKLVLQRSRPKKSAILMVRVYDLKSENGTFVNDKRLAKGSFRQAFRNGKIQVGDSIFCVVKSD